MKWLRASAIVGRTGRGVGGVAGALVLGVPGVLGCDQPPARPEAPLADSSPQPTATLPAQGQSSLPAVVEAALIIYVEATGAEIEAARMGVPEGDFAVIADDLMWYRATAIEYLEQQAVPLARITGRRPISFRAGDVIRRHEFADIPWLDFLIVYQPGQEPRVFAPNEVAASVAALGREVEHVLEQCRAVRPGLRPVQGLP